MRSAKERSGQMFAEVPRPWGLAGLLTIVVWAFVSIAFVTDAVPSSSSEDWLYNVEARRAAWAERITARELKAPSPVAARRVSAQRRAHAFAAGEREAASHGCN